MKRFLGIFLGILFTALLGVLSGSSYANAATPWDNHPNLHTGEVVLVSDDEQQTLDVTTTYLDLMLEHCAYEGFDLSVLHNVWDNGSWAVSIADFTYYGWGVEVRYTYDTRSTRDTIFNTHNGIARVQVTSEMTLMLKLENNGQVTCASNSGFETISTYSEDTPTSLLFSAYPVTYPEGYEGGTIPDTWTPPVAFDTETITIEWNSDDNKLNIRDTTEYFEELTQCFIQLPVNKQGDNFIEYHYDCQIKPWIEHDLPEIDQQFTAIVWVKVNDQWFSKSFTLPLKAGEKCNSELGCESDMLKNLLNDCLSTDFPFLHIDECGNFFYYLSNQLTFDKFNIGGIWTTGATCRQLGTIGDWIHRPNQTICPQFSKEVRDTVTPFITFMLGLLTVRFIISRTGMGT